MPNVNIRHVDTGAAESVSDRIAGQYFTNGWEAAEGTEAPVEVPAIEPPAEPVKPGRDTAPSNESKE